MSTGATTPFQGGGAMGALLRSLDWTDNPLGPVETWPQSLRTAVSIILRSRFPMFVFWGPELVQIYNDAYIPITGAKHPASQGARAQENWAEIWDDLGPLVDHVFAGEATWSQDLLLMMERNGYPEETYFTFSYSPVQDESGGIGGLFCACTETTEQVVSQRRLHTVAGVADQSRGLVGARAALRAIGEVLDAEHRDLTASALYVIDDEAGVADLVHLSGWSSEHPLVAERLVIDDPTCPWPVRSDVLTQRRPHRVRLPDDADLPTGDWSMPAGDGVLLPVVDPGSGRPIALLAGTVSPHRPYEELEAGFLSLLRDAMAKAIADATAREREQERIVAMAELHRAKTEFYSGVSHEFRTPLTLMLGPLERAVSEATALPPETAEQVLRNAHRLLKLVNHLLAFSRLEAGRTDLRFAPTELAGLTEELASSFRAAIEAAGLTFTVACAPLERPVHVDRAAWERIVLNLLSNAFKFTVTGSIDIQVDLDGSHAVLHVRDTGTGIPSEHLDRLFERFHRVPGSEGRSHEGSGIGLALVHELVELHGGEIQVASEVGRGTTFTVRLPLGTAHLPAEQVTEAPQHDSSEVSVETYVAEARGWIDDESRPSGTPGGPLRFPATVLVVDDNADMRRYLSELLSTFVQVETAGDGQEALERIRLAPPDLVLTDVMMPRMDGFELIRALREDEATRGLPIVALSARAGTEATGEGLAAGADDYVVKPFVAAELQARVRANLELARLRNEASEGRARQALLAGLSHDMQGPLAVALAAVELAQDDPEDREELLAATRRRLLHVRTLLAQLLDQAKLQIGRVPSITTVRFDLTEVLAEAIDLVAPDGGVRLVTPADAGHPPVIATADPDRTRQIAVNLLTSARRHGGTIQEVRLRAEPEWAVIDVLDPGPPLTEAEREAIFEGYEQRDLVDRDAPLGLHVSRLLSELQGGSLALEVTDDGNRFTLRLPRAHDRGARRG